MVHDVPRGRPRAPRALVLLAIATLLLAAPSAGASALAPAVEASGGDGMASQSPGETAAVGFSASWVRGACVARICLPPIGVV